MFTSRGCCFVLAVVLLPAMLLAAERRTSRARPKPVHQQVELFAGIKSGQLKVRMYPRDSREARIVIENKTRQPLSIQLPEAFAATPVLAQRPAGAAATTPQTGGMQAMGGGMGMGMGGMGMGGMGMGGMGMFNVPPEKVGKLHVACVCLEHGKAEPRPGATYELKPLEQQSSDPALKQVLKMLGRGKVDQRVAQAAAWHLANHLSWDALASKQIEHIGGPSEPYFTAEELRAAMELVNLATHLAADEKPTERQRSLGEQGSAEAADDPIKY
jgi:hypothetical protein